MAKQYARDYDEHSSYGSAVRLVERAGLTSGVILDVGCGRSPVAARLTELGFTYVGGDVDGDALADVTSRGFEAHELSLSGTVDDLADRLRAVVGDRPLAAVLALDVIEHLPDPVGALTALRRFVGGHAGAELIISIPNVTHVDLGAKLLLGRWDMTDTGLLDDTHLQFFSEARLTGMLAGTGWAEVDADDTRLAISDQCFPVDAPALRRGAPLQDVLAWVRRSAGPHGDTYQFVRRLRAVEPQVVDVPQAGDVARIVDEDRLLATVVITVATTDDADRAALDALLGDLAAQTERHFELVIVAPTGTIDAAEARRGAAGRRHLVVRVVETPGPDGPADEPDGSLDGQLGAVVAAMRTAEGRYGCVLNGRCRVSHDWLSGLREAMQTRPATLVHFPTLAASELALRFAAGQAFDDAVAHATTLPATSWNILHDGPSGPTAVAALAIPIESVQIAGIVPEPATDQRDPALVWAAFAWRVALVAGAGLASGGSVLVADDDVIDLDARAEVVLGALDDVPLVAPNGSIGLLGLMRSRLAHHRHAEVALHEKDLELHVLLHHTASMSQEIDRLHDDVAQLNHWIESRPSNLLKRLVRRMLRG